MSTASIRDGNASIRIADALRAAILSGDLAPGTRIRQEEIAGQYRASRVPVRDALRILEADRLVTLVANTGAWVSHFSLAECEEMYQVRERIEPLLLRYSFPALGAETIEQIAQLAGAIEQAADIDEILRYDREMHMLSYSGASTVVLGDTVERVWNTTHRYRRAFTLLLDADGLRVLHEEHRMLVNALRAADIEMAELVLHSHIARTRKQLAKHPEVFTVSQSM
jgi:DNA-binding GntR family transcriptional regulator